VKLSENEKFVSFIDEIINESLNKYNDEKFVNLRKDISKEYYLKEICTYHFAFPRQQGTTTFILKLLDKYLNSCLFVNKQRMVEDIKYRIKMGFYLDIDEGWKGSFINKERMEKSIFNINSSNSLRGINFSEIILIDNFSYIKPEVMNDFYNKIQPTNVKCILCFG
jgi:hypothetical protein